MNPAQTPKETVAAKGVRVLSDQLYRTREPISPYERERCRLDLYLPEKGEGFPTIVWFHGGGLQGGDRKDKPTPAIGAALAAEGVAVAAVNYRLSPKAKYPAYLEDAAAAYAWTREQIGKHGGAPGRVFIGGHSAGGYLAFMMAMDRRYLAGVGQDAARLAGVVSLAGQTVTHHAIRAERGYPASAIVADDASPLFHCRRDTPPILALYAASDMPFREEENRLFAAAMAAAGNRGVTCREIPDRNHSSIADRIPEPGDPVRRMIVDFVR